MKKIVLLNLVFLSFFVSLNAQTRTEATTEAKIKKVEQSHQNVFALPYDDDYKRNTIMAEIVEMRKTVAPHFPSRENPHPQGYKKGFEEWIEKYPKEYDAYILMVEKTTLEYAKKATKK
jgi:hypothetical protein